ncbi:MAG: DUF1398 family protein [Ginsengibacter sp.]
MFTIDQFKETHSKVKSGADFPKYVQDLTSIGVVSYDTYVGDGHSVYFGKDNFEAQSEANYPAMKVAEENNKEEFHHYLKIHQQGQADYMAFCQHSAETGVEKWTVHMNEMTCTYYDKQENKMLVEKIPLSGNVSL